MQERPDGTQLGDVAAIVDRRVQPAELCQRVAIVRHETCEIGPRAQLPPASALHAIAAAVACAFSFASISSNFLWHFAGCGAVGAAPEFLAMVQTEHLPIYKASYDLCLHLERRSRHAGPVRSSTAGAKRPICM